jgi:hypothetical protein
MKLSIMQAAMKILSLALLALPVVIADGTVRASIEHPDYIQIILVRSVYVCCTVCLYVVMSRDVSGLLLGLKKRVMNRPCRRGGQQSLRFSLYSEF